MELKGPGKEKEIARTEVPTTEASASASLAPSPNDQSMRQMSISPEDFFVRPGVGICTNFVRFGFCLFGDSCRHSHPPDRKPILDKLNEHPERNGRPKCQYYLRTGTCKFGCSCIFHHPKDVASNRGFRFNSLGYVLRPGEQDCTNYLRTGQCTFGRVCKYNHPEPPSPMRLLLAPTPAQQSYPVGLTSFSAIPHWQDPSSYAQLIIPQGYVQVPTWNPYPETIDYASTYQSPQQQSYSWVNPFFRTPPQAMVSPAYYSYGQFGSPQTGQSVLRKGSIFPQRPGEIECPFMLKTGDCKFGAKCRFHHPVEKIFRAPDNKLKLNPTGLPIHPGRPKCHFYHHFGTCRHGLNCKFDHSIATPKDTRTQNLPTSSSSDALTVQPLQGSSSRPPALPLSSERSLVAGPSKLAQLPSDSQQMNTEEKKVESE